MDDLIQQRLRLRIFNGVTVEETQPALQAVDQRIALRLLRQRFQSGQQMADPASRRGSAIKRL